MAPVWRSIDSYPEPNPHGNQMQYFHPCPPMWGPIHPQMKVEQSESPLTYSPWSYGGGYGYPSPWECHSCFQHSHHYPGYYSFRPPYSHFPQPPLACYHGPYPPYPDACPPYSIPTSHYTAEQRRYEYDKNMSGNLCSRCLNKCNPRDGSTVKIVEHEPETGKENDGSGPMKFDNNHPYPIMWIPSEYMKNKESGKAEETSKLPELEPNIWNGSKLEPKSWNGWFPHDLNSIKPLTQDGDAKSGDQDEKNSKKEQLPFPIFWIPASGKPEDAAKENTKVTTNNPKTVEEPPPMSKLIPVKNAENDDSRDQKVGERSISSLKEKEVKDIPVMENEQNVEKEPSLDTPRKGTPVKQSLETKENKSLDGNVKRKSSSPSKESKLPPICLRVDPMPKRKNGNGASRSPSLPGRQARVQEDPNGISKTSSAQAEKNESHQELKPKEPLQEIPKAVCRRKEIGVTEVEKTKIQESVMDANDQAQTNTGAPQEVLVKAITSDGETTAMVIDEHKGTTVMIEENPAQEKKEKKSLSATDAAVTIQSAFRGYEVRKWEPLKKLRQITKVSEQVNEVRKRIQVLESMADDEKKRVVIGETIMNLLIQLDTIQGLHPSFRDVRKSVARELISLQEKLDSLTSRKVESEEGSHDAGVLDPNETALDHKHDVKDSKVESKKIEHDENLFQSTVGSQSHVEEASDGPVEPEHQLGTSSTTVGDVLACVCDKDEQVQFANSPVESLDCSSVIEQKTDSGSKELAGSADEVRVCHSSVAEFLESKFRADDCQLLAPLLNLKDKKQDNSCEDPEATQDMNELSECRLEKEANLESMAGHILQKTRNVNEELEPRLEEPSPMKSCAEELSGSSSTEAMGCMSGTRSESIGAELDKPLAPLLAELPVGATDEIEKPIDSPVEKIIQLEVEKMENSNESIEVGNDANSMLQVQHDDFEPEDAPLLQLTEGESSEKLAVVFKDEEHVENHGISHSQYDGVSSLSTENAGSTLEAQGDMLITREKHEEDEALTSKVGAPTSGETRDNSCSLLGLEPMNDDVPVEGSDVEYTEDVAVKKELVDSASSSVELMEEMLHGSSAVNLKVVPPNEPKLSVADDKLVEENEKLREMLEKLMEAGKQQLTAISELHGKVRDLERKLSRKKKMKIRHKRDMSAHNMSKRDAISCAM